MGQQIMKLCSKESIPHLAEAHTIISIRPFMGKSTYLLIESGRNKEVFLTDVVGIRPCKWRYDKHSQRIYKTSMDGLDRCLTADRRTNTVTLKECEPIAGHNGINQRFEYLKEEQELLWICPDNRRHVVYPNTMSDQAFISPNPLPLISRQKLRLLLAKKMSLEGFKNAQFADSLTKSILCHRPNNEPILISNRLHKNMFLQSDGYTCLGWIAQSENEIKSLTNSLRYSILWCVDQEDGFVRHYLSNKRLRVGKYRTETNDGWWSVMHCRFGFPVRLEKVSSEDKFPVETIQVLTFSDGHRQHLIRNNICTKAPDF